VSAARRILALLDSDRQKIEALGRPAASALRVFQHAQTSPILSIQATAKKIGISFPTVTASVSHLQDLGVLRETTGKQRRRLFVYDAYLKILSEGTEPLR
jgi:Fic family protein